MKLLKMIGFLNVMAKCLQNNFLSYAQTVSSKRGFMTKSFIAQRISSFKVSHKKVAKMTTYPEWGYTLAPEHENYDVIERRYSKNFDFVYTVYQHKNTKMQVISIGSHDPLDTEEGFAFYVKTLPTTDEGIPHILEHTVLSGSHKYKSPFTTLMKGSLYSLLNAYTYTDRTVFLARSINRRDFLNILDVYIDCVFRPSVMEKKLFFDREGWSYMLTPLTEQEKKDDTIPKIKDYKVSYNGIVFNEMKGNFSNPINLLVSESLKSLFPDNTYSKISGGHPEFIPQLTYERFKEFYIKNYHPKKIKLFISSNKNCKEVLDFVDQYLKEIDLSKYKGGDDVEQIQFQKYIEGPIYKKEKYANNSPHKENMVLVSWVLNPTKRNENDVDLSLELPIESFALAVINYLLVQTSSSVLHKALIESGLGTGVLKDVLYNDVIQHVFSIGLKGISENSLEKSDKFGHFGQNVHYAVESIIINALKDEVKKGFNREAIEAAVNVIQFQLKEENLKPSKGTDLMLEFMSKLNYNRDPLEDMDFDIYLQKVLDNVKTIPRYLENIVEKHLINNKHRVVLFLEADDKIESEYDKKEQESLKKRIDSLTEKEKEDIIKAFNDLKEDKSQNVTPEDINKIPLISLEDLKKETLEVPVTLYFTNSRKQNDWDNYEMIKNNKDQAYKNMQYFKKIYVLNDENKDEVPPTGVSESDIPFLVHEINTDGIVYLYFTYSLNEFTLEEFYYLNLFKTLILENKTAKRSEEEFILLKEKNVGRLDAAVHLYSEYDRLNVINKYKNRAVFHLEVHALKNKCNDALDIAMEAFKESDFSNKKKVIEILKRFIDSFRTKITQDADFILSWHLRAHFSSAHYAENVLYGFENYKKLLEILKLAENNYEEVQKKLTNIRTKLFNSKKLVVNLTADKDTLEYLFTDCKPAFKNFLSHFRNNPNDNNVIRWNEEIKHKNYLEIKKKKDLLVAPTFVNYVGMAGTLFKERDYLSPAYSVVISALQNEYLWEVVREINGAYGVSTFLNLVGYVFFRSYRDPQLEGTIQAFKESVSGLRAMAGSLTDKELLRYIIYMIRKIDKSYRGVTLGNVSYWRIMQNETEEDRKKYREGILNTNKEDFENFASILEKHLKELESNVVIITNDERAENFKKNNKDFQIIQLQ